MHCLWNWGKKKSELTTALLGYTIRRQECDKKPRRLADHGNYCWLELHSLQLVYPPHHRNAPSTMANSP